MPLYSHWLGKLDEILRKNRAFQGVNGRESFIDIYKAFNTQNKKIYIYFNAQGTFSMTDIMLSHKT